jgi:hypothetical protein
VPLLPLVLAGTVVYQVLSYGVVVTGPDSARRRVTVAWIRRRIGEAGTRRLDP